jgi:hypothetical protein
MTKLPLKKWFHTTKVLMVPKPVDQKEDKKKGKKKPVKGKKGKVVKEEEEEESDPDKPPELIPKTVR